MKFNILPPSISQSQDENMWRRGYMLNIILCVSLLILILWDIVILRNSIAQGTSYTGISVGTFTAIICAHCALLFLSKKGYSLVASYILITLYWVCALHCGYKWGTNLPITLVTFIFIIFISSILISSKFGIKVAIITLLSLLLLGTHERMNPDIVLWKMDIMSDTDLMVYSMFLIGIALVSFLSNREAEKSLARARRSEQELKNERDALEMKVIERTRELNESQLSRMNELARVAEFGRISQGLFHDLLSPLTAMVLHMEKIRKMPVDEIHRSCITLDKIVVVSKKMIETLHRLKSSMKTSMPQRICVIHTEVNTCIELLRFKITEHNVEFKITGTKNCRWHGDPMKLHQVFLNTISNAIDACGSVTCRARRIEISITRCKRKCKIKIKDNGIGMCKTTLGKIFDPFFTTKTPEHGTGIGLTTVERIIKEIGGTISVTSLENKGSTFTIVLPLR
jgi:signal transduction histidine kinase